MYNINFKVYFGKEKNYHQLEGGRRVQFSYNGKINLYQE